MFLTKVARENKTRVLGSVTFYLENRDLCEITWKKCGSTKHPADGNVVRRMHFASWVTKATHTHTHTHNRICRTNCFSTAIFVNNSEYVCSQLFVQTTVCNTK
jgi:hypothetical protein